MNPFSNHCQKRTLELSFLFNILNVSTREINIFLQIQVRNMWSFKLIVGTKLNSNEISFVSQAYLLMTVVKLAINFISGVTVTLSTDIGQRR